MHILLVEDQALVAIEFASALEARGHEVTTVSSAPAALTAAQDRLPDLALLDVDLGAGKPDGIVVAGELNELAVPVIFVSSEHLNERTVRAMSLGHVWKPYGTDAVIAAVDWAEKRISGNSVRAPLWVRFSAVS